MKNPILDIEDFFPITKPQQQDNMNLDAFTGIPRPLYSLLELETAFTQYEGIFESLEEVLEEMW